MPLYVPLSIYSHYIIQAEEYEAAFTMSLVENTMNLTLSALQGNEPPE